MTCPKCGSGVSLERYDIDNLYEETREHFVIAAKGYCDYCLKNWIFQTDIVEDA